MQKYYQIICENNNAVKRIYSDKVSGRLSHCYIVSVGSDSEIEQVLLAAASKILCPNGGCGVCDICLRIEHGNMYDMQILGREKIDRDMIEELIEDTYIKPLDSNGRKLYLIIGGEKMSEICQNKLLKTLEEPNEKVTIIIGTSNESRLMETVKSRAVKLESGVLSDDIIKKYLLANTKSSIIAIEIAIALAVNSVSLAVQILENERFVSQYADIISMLEHMRMSGDCIKYTASSIFDDDNIKLTLSLLELVFRDIIVLLAGCEELMSVESSINAYRSIATRYNIPALTNCIQAINNARARMELNCNKQGIVDNLLLTILEVRYKCSK